MLETFWIVGASFFVMAAACYLLLMTSGPLEKLGRRLGHLLHLPEDVIASTFQALATSGPEIVKAILAATAFVAEGFTELSLDEKGASGCLNMCFSAMANLLGIGSLGMIYMMLKKMVKPNDSIEVAPSVIIGLGGDIRRTFPKDFGEKDTADMPILKDFTAMRQCKLMVDLAAGATIDAWVAYGHGKYGYPVAGGCTAVSATDYAHGCGLFEGKADQYGAGKGYEDAQLCAGTDQKGFWIGYEWAEIGHGPQAEKNDAGDDFPFQAIVIKYF